MVIECAGEKRNQRYHGIISELADRRGRGRPILKFHFQALSRPGPFVETFTNFDVNTPNRSKRASPLPRL